jgi:hypothetical protein
MTPGAGKAPCQAHEYAMMMLFSFMFLTRAALQSNLKDSPFSVILNKERKS